MKLLACWLQRNREDDALACQLPENEFSEQLRSLVMQHLMKGHLTPLEVIEELEDYSAELKSKIIDLHKE